LLDGAAESARRAGWGYYELPTGHDAMVSMPTEVAAILESVGAVDRPSDRAAGVPELKEVPNQTGLTEVYRLVYTLPEHWSAAVGPDAPAGGTSPGEARHLLAGEGRCEGQVKGRARVTNHPRRRTDGLLEADFRGAIDTNDGAVILFRYTGLAQVLPGRILRVMGLALHDSDDIRYRWMTTTSMLVAGNVPLDEPPAELTVLSAERVWGSVGPARRLA
jgi:hypothetical protein